MTITAADIKLLESEVMTDASDGGGRRTTNVIPDGVAGNIFPKVSRLDSVYGRVNLRKIYGHVDTANVDTYAGAHAIVTDPPDNDKIGVLLFSTGSDFDRRSSARDRIESYVVAGPESRLRLYGNQPVGAKAVLAYQRESEPLPDIGDVYALQQKNSGGDVLATQYIRVDSLDHEVRTFVDDNGEYKYRIITLTITSPITYAFTGPDTPPRTSGGTRLGKVMTTSAADTARYYGVQPITEAVTTGALSFKLNSIYAAIVPTTQREAPISLASIAGANTYVDAGMLFSDDDGNSGTYRFPFAVKPGTLRFTNSSSGWPVYDDGNGVMLYTGRPDLAPGSVDYDSGSTTFALISAGGGVDVRATHVAPVSQASHTAMREVTLNNRGSVYSEAFTPVPAPRSLIVDYRALGKWYRLRDENGDGTLTGFDSSIGTGTVDYTTGAVVVTLGALPDVDSAVLFTWGSDTHYVKRAGTSSDADPKIRQHIQLDKKALSNNPVVVTFVYAQVELELTFGMGASAASISGKVSGTLDRTQGTIDLTYDLLPDIDSSLLVECKSMAFGSTPDPTGTRSFTVLAGVEVTTLDYQAAMVAGTVSGYVPMSVTLTGNDNPSISSNVDGIVRFKDDGAGNIVTIDSTLNKPNNYGQFGANPMLFGKVAGGQVIGTVNYSTGVVTITSPIAVTGNVWQPPFGLRLGLWLAAGGSSMPKGASGYNTAALGTLTSGASDAAADFTQAVDFADAPLLINLTRSTGQAVVPGSVAFKLGASPSSDRTRLFVDRNGTIVYEPSASNGAGTVFGSINYLTGEVSLTRYGFYQTSGSNNPAGTVSVLSCLTQIGQFTTDRVFFRTSGSPLRAGSLFVRGYTVDGTLLSGSADINGVITGTLVSGTVDQVSGVASVRFGEWKPKVGNETAPWYDAENIDPNDATRVWKPEFMDPTTVRYSAVVVTNVTLDTSILGIDPVRLPLDGRVPMVRPADVGVLHNTQVYELPSSATAGATYNVGRTGLSDLWLVDADGVRVDPTKYTVDMDLGTVTMAAPLDLTGVPQPLRAKHRISDMLLVADAQINGQVDVASTIAHDYPVDGTYFSTALLIGDLYARVSGIFDQVTWTGVWSDLRIGDQANAEFNSVLYPIEVLNNGAITERWRIQFTSTTAFQCFGENSGLVATGSTAADFGPINPLTLEPYFVIRAGGWGSGWAVGNQLRFNTYGASAPIWAARTILPGATLAGDSVDIQLRGDVDA